MEGRAISGPELVTAPPQYTSGYKKLGRKKPKRKKIDVVRGGTWGAAFGGGRRYCKSGSKESARADGEHPTGGAAPDLSLTFNKKVGRGRRRRSMTGGARPRGIRASTLRLSKEAKMACARARSGDDTGTR